MAPSPDSPSQLRRELEQTRARLAEAEQTLQAIGSGAVDGLVVAGPDGTSIVYTLAGAQEPYRLLIEQMSEGAMTLTREGNVLYANQAMANLLKTPLEQLIGAQFHSFCMASATFSDLFDSAWRQTARGEISARCLGGETVPLRLALSRMDMESLELLCVVVSDLTEHKQAESLMQAAKVFACAREGIIITTPNGTILNVNDSFTRITGYDKQEVLGRKASLLNSGRHDEAFYEAMWRDLTDKGHWYGEIWNRRKNGEVFVAAFTITAASNDAGTAEHYVALFTDVTLLKQHQEQLEQMAHFDGLTKMPNRLLLSDRLRQGMVNVERRAQTLAVAYLDLDGFKAVNDQYGHEIGDQLLIALADRLKKVLRDGDTLARIGGDEFVVVLIDLTAHGACVPLLGRLLRAAARPVQLGDLSLQISASIGVTFYPQAKPMEADQLLRQADQAMYQAKLSGKNQYHIFDEMHDSWIRQRNESIERIRVALREHELVLHYQPKVNMRSGKVIGAEALIRWQHPHRGLLEPDTFLPLIEDDPLVVVIGEWVIDTALKQLEIWQAEGCKLPISLNVAPRQLEQLNFIDTLRAILAAHPQVNPSCIELEILETSALKDIAKTSRMIDACKRLGVGFALDDFGTGYSSLTYLRSLQGLTLKIDQSFVRDILGNPEDTDFLKLVIGLAASLERQIIAEGVETVAHGTLLLQLGCDLGQGYGIARPMPADEVPAWAASWQPDAAWFGIGPPH
jgi:diguanylate cyclase (GGDEF)-like protein/PAS domain S-box-containing protein